MSFYDTTFDVKYNDIREELLEKVRRGGVEYSTEDVENICEELYRHELLSVFKATDINDDAINLAITDIFSRIITNILFKQTFEVIVTRFCKLNIDYDELSSRIHGASSETTPQRNLDLMVFSSLFTHKTFHITHKCIRHIMLNIEDNVTLTCYLNALNKLSTEFYNA